MMTLPRSVADVLSDHVTFEVECIDRMYSRSPRRGTRTKRIPARAAASRTRTTMIRRVQPRSTRHAEGGHLQRADVSPSALAGDLNVYLGQLPGRNDMQQLRVLPSAWPRYLRGTSAVLLICA